MLRLDCRSRSSMADPSPRDGQPPCPAWRSASGPAPRRPSHPRRDHRRGRPGPQPRRNGRARPSGLFARGLRSVDGCRWSPRRGGASDRRHRPGRRGRRRTRAQRATPTSSITAASFGPVRQVMTNDWLDARRPRRARRLRDVLLGRSRPRCGAVPRRRARPVPRQPRRRPVRRLPRSEPPPSARRCSTGRRDPIPVGS